jgi:hypothetical protein
MSRRRLLVHAALALLLLLLLVGEALYGWRLQQRLQQHAAAVGDGQISPVTLPALATGSRDLSAYAAMVEQPLFHESRKPQRAAAIEINTAMDTQGELDEWQLVGIISLKQQPKVLISHKSKAQKSQQLTVGQSIAGWKIQRIQPDRVLIMRDSQSKTILLRKPRADAAAASPPLAKGGFPTAFPLPPTPTAPKAHDDE